MSKKEVTINEDDYIDMTDFHNNGGSLEDLQKMADAMDKVIESNSPKPLKKQKEK